MTFVKPQRATVLRVGAALSPLSDATWADCDPPCSPDEVRRDEAAGDTFDGRARPPPKPRRIHGRGRWTTPAASGARAGRGRG